MVFFTNPVRIMASKKLDFGFYTTFWVRTYFALRHIDKVVRFVRLK